MSVWLDIVFLTIKASFPSPFVQEALALKGDTEGLAPVGGVLPDKKNHRSYTKKQNVTKQKMNFRRAQQYTVDKCMLKITYLLEYKNAQ